MKSINFKIEGELELYDLDKFQEELFVFLQESDNVGNFFVDFNEDKSE